MAIDREKKRARKREYMRRQRADNPLFGVDPEKRREYQREYMRRYRAMSPEQRAKAREERRAKSKWTDDHFREYHRRKTHEYRSTNRELVKDNARRRYHEDIEAHRAKYRRYRSRKKGAAGHHTLEQWMARVEYHGWRCRYCDCKLTLKTLTMDHVIPLNKGGSEWSANLVPACKPCNSGKQDRPYKFIPGRIVGQPPRYGRGITDPLSLS